MHVTPSFTGRQKGWQPEEEPLQGVVEEPGHSVICSPPPCPSPVLSQPVATPEVVPPAGGSLIGSSKGGTSFEAWEVPVQEPGALGGVTPASASVAIDSDGASENEWSEYEREGATSGSSSPLAPAKAGSSGGWRRRPRKHFSLEQIQALERTFQTHFYLGVPERRQLAASLGVSDKQVKTWFQNRRMKLKKKQWQSLRPPNFSQEFSMYPQQSAPPFMPDSGLPPSSPCPLYQPPQDPPYPPLAPRLLSHFPPELLMHPDVQYELDCMPAPHSAE